MRVACITGALRDMVDFYDIVDVTLKAREAGLIDAVWLSTWRGEFDQTETGLKDRLLASGIGIVEGELPERNVPGPTWGYLVQATSISNAIERLAPDDVVLKLRTDKCTRHLLALLRRLRDMPDGAGKERDAYSVLDQPLMVNRLKATVPFHASDMVYCGRVSDVARLVRPDLWPEVLCTAAGYGPEGRWLPTPFMLRNHSLAATLRRVDAIRFGAAICDAAGDGPEMPDAAVSLLTLWMLYARSNFSATPAGKLDTGLTVEEVLAGTKPGGVVVGNSRRGGLAVAPGDRFFSAILDGELPTSPLLSRIGDAVEQLHSGYGRLPAGTADAILDWLGETGPAPVDVHAPVALQSQPSWDSVAPFTTLVERSQCPAEERRILHEMFAEYDRRHAPTLYLRIGDAYAEGDRLPVEIESARYWWRLSAAMRNREAGKRLDTQ